jgi:tight adherence protein C
MVERVGGALAQVLPHNLIRKVDRMLVMGGEPWSRAAFLTVWLAVATGGVLFWLWVVSGTGASPLQTIVLAIPCALFPALLPYARLRQVVLNRQKAIIRSLPDGLDLLTASVEAGLGSDSAFALVADQTSGPLSEAFALYLREIGLGRARHDALRYAADRTGVDDLVALAAAINQGEELGTTMGDVMRRQARELRLLRRQRIQAAAQRAPVLMTIPLATCFLPAMGAIVIVPSILNLLNFIEQ